MNTTHYTVLTYIINNYEIIHPVKEKSDRARYILVTDNPDLVDESGSWEVVYDESLTGSTFDKCYQIRFNPWRYTDDSIVLRIDGSVGVERNLDALIDKYIDGGYEMSLMLHPTRNTQYDEYVAWVRDRGYSMDNANAVLGFMQMAEGFPVKEYKGLAQMCYSIQTRCRWVENLNLMTYTMLRYLGDDTTGIERVDQTVFSFVLQKYFGGAKDKVMWVDQRMYDGQWFAWYAHNTNHQLIVGDAKDWATPYFWNKRLTGVIRPQDI